MATKKIAVDLFYDVISPYSWIGFEQLMRHQNVWKSTNIRLKPFVLGFVMKGADNKPPLMVPNKAKYMLEDIPRTANYFKVPLKMLGNFIEIAMSMGSLSAMRFVMAIDMETQGKATEAVSRELFKRMFTSHRDIGKDESLREAGSDAGIDSSTIDKAIQSRSSPLVKDQLKANVDEALSYAAFGAPTIVAHLPSGRQIFFGCDRTEILAHLLGEKYHGPLLEYSKL